MNQNSVPHEKNSGQWIRIPLLIKKVMGNGSEFHYLSIK